MIYDAEKNTIDGKPASEYESQPYEKGFRYPNAFNAILGTILMIVGSVWGGLLGGAISFTGLIMVILAIYHFLKGTYAKK